MAHKSPNKITVLMSDEEFDRFDAYCRERGYKKSTLIARLIRQYLNLDGFGRDSSPNRYRNSSGQRRD
jgi:metal-responsive CopG/Arc/MetJ family transcriptional regulator